MSKFALPAIVLLALSVAGAACSPLATPHAPDVAATRVSEGAREATGTATKSPAPAATATPEPQHEEPRQLVICMSQEPETLLSEYVGGTNALVKRAVLYALQDPVYTTRSYGYQAGPVLEKLPDLSDGDAELIDVQVVPGMRVLDVSSGEVMTYTGQPTTMQAIRATFRFKDGLTWEDGTPLTAWDSVFAYELSRRPDSGYVTRFVLDRTASYEALDHRTAVWTGIPGFLDPTYSINVWTPLPKHELEWLTPGEIRKNETFSRAPLSFGPYSLRGVGAEWVAGDHITVVKNPRYWRADEGLPHFQKVTFKFIPDTNQLVAQMLARECDVITQDAALEQQIPLLEQAEAQGVVKVHSVPGTVWEHIDFQLDPVDGRVPIGRCFPVRRALAMGIDRRLIVDQVLLGAARVLDTFIPREHPFYDPTVPKYEFDPPAASRILEESGWIDSDGDGIREARGVSCEWVNWRTRQTERYQVPDGTRLSLALITTAGNEQRETVAQIVQANLKQIGVEIRIEHVPAGILFGAPPDGPLTGRKFDLVQYSWLSEVEPGGNLYRCTEVPDLSNGYSGSNFPSWCHPAFDAAVNAAQSSLDKDVRATKWHEAQQILQGEQGLPFIPMYQRLKIVVSRPDLRGLIPDPTENSELWNLARFAIEPR